MFLDLPIIISNSNLLLLFLFFLIRFYSQFLPRSTIKLLKITNYMHTQYIVCIDYSLKTVLGLCRFCQKIFLKNRRLKAKRKIGEKLEKNRCLRTVT